MKHRMRRRAFIAGMTAVSVVAFDPLRRSWITAAHADTGCGVPIPSLDGQLVCDATALSEAADDFGHIIHRTPIAVLRPGSVHDIKKLVKYANDNGIKVAMRGQGHATQGQAQTLGGVVIDSRSLATIHDVSPSGAVVDAGVRWIDLLEASVASGLTPPVLTDFIELSVGGTLSVGGIGGALNRQGMQVDNVLELQVITGDGQPLTCSPSLHSDLFEAVLGGLGQYGIIVGATVRLIPAPTNARVYHIFYTDLEMFMNDQRTVVSDERFDFLQGQVLPADGGGWMYLLEAAAYYTPPAAPDDAALLSGLAADPASAQIEEHSYFDWSNRLAPLVAFLRAVGAWDIPHPFFDVFVPNSAADSYVGGVLSNLTTADTGGGPVLLYPFKTDKLTRPLVEVPTQGVAWSFSILRFAPPVPPIVDGMIAQNRALYEALRDVGGKKYPIGSIPFSPSDWVDHYGNDYALVQADKAKYDPNHVLTPGQGIFEPV